VNNLKTALFATCYIGKPEQIERYRHWLKFYSERTGKLGIQRIILVDDGSRMDYLSKLGLPIIKIEEHKNGSFPELTEPAYIFRFPDNLGRPETTIIPGWWRGFSFMSIFALHYGLDKLIHIESDAYILSDKMLKYMKEETDNWKSFYCFYYQYPESAIQIIPKISIKNWFNIQPNKNNFELIFKQFFLPANKFWYKDNIGNAQYIPEYCLPFDEIIKDFKGDRYGEDWCKEIPEDIEYIVNISDVSLNGAIHRQLETKYQKIQELIKLKPDNKPKSAFHSGAMEDIVYSIPTMRELGVKTVNLNPAKWWGAFNFDKSQAEFISKLLESEGFDCHIIKPEEIVNSDYCMDKFRYSYQDLQFEHLVISIGNAHGLEINPATKWLTSSGKKSKDVLLSHTSRYHGVFFDWFAIIQALKKMNATVGFLGSKSDYELFIKENPKAGGYVEYLECKDAAEMKDFIAGCKLFIGNQSLPYSIAEGLKVPRIQETCEWASNCLPEGKNGTSVISYTDLMNAIGRISTIIRGK